MDNVLSNLAPPAPSETVVQVESKARRQQATVYDAVAGRISAAGFISNTPTVTATRDTASSSSTAVPPESVLFRRQNAPTRYEESDFYFANELLPPHVLPESDLLKELHCYTSEFYSRATIDGGKGDYRSMDETALLALGILMEESCRELLGKTGDFVFTEGEGENQSPRDLAESPQASGQYMTDRRRKRRKVLDKSPQPND